MLYRFAIARPRLTLLLAALVTFSMAPGAYWLRIRTDGNALLPHSRPEIGIDRQIRDEFGILDQIAVIVRNDSPEGIFNGRTLLLVDRLTQAFKALPGVDPVQVMSLATEKNFRVFPGTLMNRTFVQRPPRPPEKEGEKQEPQTRPATPQTRPAMPQIRPTTRQTRPAPLQTKPAMPQTRPTTRQTRPPTPSPRPPTPQTRPMPQTRPATPQARPRTPQTRPATRQAPPATPQTRPPVPQTRPASPDAPFVLHQTAPEVPWTQSELDGIREDLRRIKLYTGTFLSYDGKATAVLIGVPDGADRPQLYHTIQNIIAAFGDIPEEVYVVGAPVAESLLGTHILEDLGVPETVLGHRLKSDSIELPLRIPRSLHELRLQIGRHIGLVPVSMIVMALVFIAAFRGVFAAALPLMEVGACLVAVFGLMGWLGVPVYLTIAVLPVILTVVGITDEIHIFSWYRRNLLRKSHELHSVSGTDGDFPIGWHRSVVSETMQEMAMPVIMASVTSAIGFLSFVFSPLKPVQMFGWFTSFGVIFCMIWSLTAIPASLVLIDPHRFAPLRRVVSARTLAGGWLFPWVGRMALRFRVPLLLAGAAVLVAAPFGVKKVVVQDSWIDGFAPESRFRRATTLVNQQFHGTHILIVCVDTGGPIASGDLAMEDVGLHEAKIPASAFPNPEDALGKWISIQTRDSPSMTASAPSAEVQLAQRIRMERKAIIEEVQRDGDRWVIRTSLQSDFLNPPKLPGIDELVSYKISPRRLLMPDTLKQMDDLEAFIESKRDLAVGGVIGSADYVTTTEFMFTQKDEAHDNIPDTPGRVSLLLGHYRRVRGEQRFREMMSTDHSKALITVFMKEANFQDTGRLLREIRAYEAEHLAPLGIKLSFAGDVAVSQTMIDAIVNTQVQSVLLSLLGIWVVAAVLGQSALWGLYCVIPCSVAVLVNFAVMGWCGIPLGVATSMFSAMTLGIGVDYAIHVAERFRSAVKVGTTKRQGILGAITDTGPAILVDALAIACGFGILVLSQVPPNARLGALVVVSVINCFFATFALMPALLSFRREKRAGRTTVLPEVPQPIE